MRRSSSSTFFPYTTLFRSLLYSFNTLLRIDRYMFTFVRLIKQQQNDIPTKYETLHTNTSNNSLFKFFMVVRSEEHTSELQSRGHLVFHLLLEKNDDHSEFL